MCVIPEGTNHDPISGYVSRESKTVDECKFECVKYKWCRGIRIRYTDNKPCRLLTNESSPIDGWKYYNSGNWVEPTNWKESIHNKAYQCLEKVEISEFKFLMGFYLHQKA